MILSIFKTANEPFQKEENKIKVVLLALFLCLIVETVHAQSSWVLWKKETTQLSKGTQDEIKWNIEQGAGDYNTCLAFMIIKFKELSSLANYLKKTADQVEIIEAPPGKIYISFFSNEYQTNLFKTIELICLPDTIDPRK